MAGLYLHIPFCKRVCAYCDFYSLSGRERRMDDYQKALLAHLPDLTDSVFAKVEIAGPGFINLFLSPAYWAGVVLGACANKE